MAQPFAASYADKWRAASKVAAPLLKAIVCYDPPRLWGLAGNGLREACVVDGSYWVAFRIAVKASQFRENSRARVGGSNAY